MMDSGSHDFDMNPPTIISSFSINMAKEINKKLKSYSKTTAIRVPAVK